MEDDTIPYNSKNIRQNNKIIIANVYCFGLQKKTFCYKVNYDQRDVFGSVVKVSFGKKILTGIVLSLQEKEVNNDKIYIEEKELAIDKLKNVDEILYKNLISENFLNFLHKMAWYNVIHVERLFENVVLSAWLNKKREIQQKQEEKKKHNDLTIIELNEEQNKISNSIKIDDFGVNLLYGVMGSGKTYIFLDVVRRVLLQNINSQVLIMVPEIALTSNLIDIVYNFCGIEPVIWHSSVAIAKKKVYFDGIIKGDIRIVISTRSGLLLPYKNLSLIVIDEEHDTSYKQDEVPVYNARDMAILRAKCENIPIILASASPSVETIVNVMEKKYQIYKINTQFFNLEPPKIEIINLLECKNLVKNISNEIKDKNGEKITNYISKKAREAIIETLKKGQQSMVFINRRGYSRTLKCENCGYEASCKNCDNLLSYHKQKGVLRCHYCGYVVNNVKKCINCGCEKLSASRGAGVEQIEKEIHSFCDAKTLIFSSDEIHKEGDVDAISSEIKNGDIDVVIGTQIVAKGHHFPRLTNIVVLDIDGMTLDGDFRAFEKMFQLLFQLSGRAGREKKGATIFIQTANPENKTLKLLAQRDIKQFYANEIKQRKKFNLPPYFRFVSVVISSENKELAYKTSQEVLVELKRYLHKCIEILGPTESNVYFLKRNYRYRFLLKADKKADIFTGLNKFYQNFVCPRGVHLKIDVDPYSFL